MARQTTTPTAWMHLLLVCELWKRIACDIAELWRVIHVNSNPNWLQLCLDRAARSLIDLHLTNISARHVQATKHLILPHKDRIRAMRINDSHYRLKTNIADLFTIGMTALEELSFVPVEWRVKEETSFALSAQTFPRIQSLTLSGISIPREPSFYRNIRSLELHEQCCKGNQFTILDLFDALQAASHSLEDLDLSRFDPIQEPRPVERPQFHLRNLRSLCMDNSFRLASQIVKHLLIPPRTHLRLRIALAEGEAIEHHPTERLLAAIVPPNIRVVLDQAEELAVLVERERFRVRVLDKTPSSPFPGLRDRDILRSERVRVEILGSYYPAEALRAVPVVCAAPLTTLSINSPNIQHDIGDWRLVLGAFPALENLVLHGWKESWTGTIGLPFKALTKETDMGLPATTGSTKGIARCPSLKTVRVEGYSAWALLDGQELHQFLDIVVECLQSREGYARRLETLTLRSFLRDEACGELEALVDKVEILI
ncbi:hypothetical protein V8D89_002699 [Ganoderma adspersum]